MEKKDHVYDALKILIKLSKEAQGDRDSLKYCSFMQWLKEYCTIKICSARRAGHTEALKKLIIEDKMNIGCFVPNRQWVNIIKKDYKETVEKDINEGKLEFCTDMNSIDFLRGKNFSNLDAIVVDQASFFSQKKIDKIYDLIILTICRNKIPFYLIFLQ